KGKWIVKAGKEQPMPMQLEWSDYDIEPLVPDWDLTMEDLQFTTPIGLEMVNDVIIKPYPIETDITPEEIPEEKDDAFLLLIDRHGKWRVNSTLKGFTNQLGTIASTYSTTG